MSPQLPQPWQAFAASIRDFISYPENVVHRTTYLDALSKYKIQLDDIEKKLFVTKDQEVNVPFRDLIDPAFERNKIQNDSELQMRLGEASRVNPDLSKIKPDPKCRFIFIYADHSIAPLKITRKMLVRVLSYYQVMPSYLEFLFVFGIHKHSREQRFSGFRSELMLSDGHNAAIASLGRSGRQFQLCYNLKTVGKWMEKGQLRPSDENWSIRQGAFYHQFDVKNGNSLWIITRAGLDIKQRVESMTGKTGRSEDRQFQDLQQSLRSSLAVHLLLCHWSVENWRPYFQWSEETVERETYGVVHGPRGHDEPQRKSSTSHLQKAQVLEEQITEAITVLKGNRDVFLSLRDFYQSLRENSQSPLKGICDPDLSSFAKQVDSFVWDSNMQIERGRLLVDIVSARKQIILQHLQSQATEKMEKLTLSMQRDSLTVRIIAFLTFLYLPATFVSTFFSTDIVKYQDQNLGDKNGPGKNNSASFSALALYRWLQVTLPLTFLTFIAALLWLWRVNWKIKKANEELPTTEIKTH